MHSEKRTIAFVSNTRLKPLPRLIAAQSAPPTGDTIIRHHP